jgi:hypothetical protein
MRYRVFQGIGWGIQYRYEGTGEIQAVLPQLERLAVGERVAVLAGMRWVTNVRVGELRQRVASGEASERDRAQLERLELLRASVEAAWNRTPPHMRFSDRIFY